MPKAFLSNNFYSIPKKRSVSINGHATSFTLEDCFWIQLKDYVARNNLTLASFIKELDVLRTQNTKKPIGLSCIIRQFLFHEFIKKHKT